MTSFKATIIKHTPSAEHDLYDDGASQVFNGVTLKINEPDPYKEKDFFILIPNDQINEDWQTIGKELSFKIDPLLIEEDNFTFYDGALDDIKWKA